MKNLALKAAVGSALWRNVYWSPPRKFKGCCRMCLGTVGKAHPSGWIPTKPTFLCTQIIVEVLVLWCRIFWDILNSRARRLGKFIQMKWETILCLSLWKTLSSSSYTRNTNSSLTKTFLSGILLLFNSIETQHCPSLNIKMLKRMLRYIGYLWFNLLRKIDWLQISNYIFLKPQKWKINLNENVLSLTRIFFPGFSINAASKVRLLLPKLQWNSDAESLTATYFTSKRS